MPYILQLETSTDVCSASISCDGVLVSIEESSASNVHTEQITLLISSCVRAAGISLKDISAVAISDGPGSYTSLRVGLATAKGICHALDIPLIAISSLAILAHGIDESLIQDHDIIIPMIDARRMEVYTAVYDHKRRVLEDAHALILSETSYDIYDKAPCIHVCGNGSRKYIDTFVNDKVKIHHQSTSSSYMTTLATEAWEASSFIDVAYFTPNYLKGANITISSKKYF